MARYGKDRKGETRQRIVELASRRFRSEGVDGVGIASLMADAGLTNGGFYAHFASKEDLVKEAVLFAMGKSPARFDPEPGRPLDLPRFIDGYLSTAHRDAPEAGCAVAALSPDMTRRPPASRKSFNEEGMAMIDRIGSGLPAGIDGEERRARAFAVFSHLLGTLQMARLMADASLSDQILDRGKKDAKRLAGLET